MYTLLLALPLIACIYESSSVVWIIMVEGTTYSLILTASHTLWACGCVWIASSLGTIIIISITEYLLLLVWCGAQHPSTFF
nr:NADH dehydrogenase subunit 4L [Rhynchopus humris]